MGGDTVASKGVVINVALLGEARRQDIVYRKGAKLGDGVFVTGPLGGSLASGRHLTFIPRVSEAQFLVRKCKPHAMIDISDGLVADLGHILEESRVGAVLEEKALPLNKGATLANALYDGEDFELLFTLPPATGKKQLAVISGRRFYKIGTVVSQKAGLTMIDRQEQRRPLPRRGYTHF